MMYNTKMSAITMTTCYNFHFFTRPDTNIYILIKNLKKLVIKKKIAFWLKYCDKSYS